MLLGIIIGFVAGIIAATIYWRIRSNNFIGLIKPIGRRGKRNFATGLVS